MRQSCCIVCWSSNCPYCAYSMMTRCTEFLGDHVSKVVVRTNKNSWSNSIASEKGNGYRDLRPTSTGSFSHSSFLPTGRLPWNGRLANQGLMSSIHYNDVIMSAMAFQFTSLTIVYSTAYSRRIKETSRLRVTDLCGGIHRWPLNSPHKGPVTRKIFPFDDSIEKTSNWYHASESMLIDCQPNKFCQPDKPGRN